ncbi:MAG: ATP-binding protein, partial [Tistlia sp.]
MCRWTVHAGEPVFLEQLVLEPCHSLIAQSQHAREAKAETNGDGFGLGWYGERPEPGLYREILPAWSDANLRSLCQQLRARLFFAHVRASTGTATARANCHPFAFGRWLFMHNGQIGGYERIRRRVEALIPDALYGDSGRLRQVIVNLVGNAVKFTERGEVVLDIALAASAVEALSDEGPLLEFSVADTGIGIPPEKRESIFQAFEQADTSITRKYGGTGLGLSISARLVELMGGGLSVESAPGRGSTFRFALRFG